MLLRLFILLGLVVFPSLSYAQGSEGLGGYVPPPLFAEPQFPSEDQKVDELGLPVVSRPAPVAVTEDEKKQTKIREKIFKKIDEEVLKNKEPVKKEPVRKVKPPLPLVKPEDREIVRPGVEPIDFIRRQKQKEEDKKKSELAKAEATKEEIKKEEVAVPVKKFEAPKPSEGVVKGPKTMPSVKKQSVDAEITFEALEPPPVNMIDRVQEESVEKIEQAEPVKIVKSDMPLPEFQKQADGNNKLVLKYKEDQSDLENEQLRILQELIIPQMEANTDSRLLIEAYASPRQEDNVSADRRLALSRALAIREYAMGQKIASNRIDVRSLGAQSNIQPLDRVELYLTP